MIQLTYNGEAETLIRIKKYNSRTERAYSYHSIVSTYFSAHIHDFSSSSTTILIPCIPKKRMLMSGLQIQFVNTNDARYSCVYSLGCFVKIGERYRFITVACCQVVGGPGFIVVYMVLYEPLFHC